MSNEQQKANEQAMVGGNHYRKNGSEIQHWDIVHIFNLDYFQGQITKYAMRWKDKGGLDDLLKCRHYLDKYIECVKANQERRIKEGYESIHFQKVNGGTECGFIVGSNKITMKLSEVTCNQCRNLARGGLIVKEDYGEYTEPMTPDEYVDLAMRTKCDQAVALVRMSGGNFDRAVETKEIQLTHAIIGLCGESGELASALQKWVWYGKPVDRENIKEELGDKMWYIAEACEAMGFSLQDIMESNIRKLRVRYPEKFIEELAAEENRNRQAEAQALNLPRTPFTESITKAGEQATREFHEIGVRVAEQVEKAILGTLPIPPVPMKEAAAKTLGVKPPNVATSPNQQDDMSWYGVKQCECCDQLAKVRIIDGSPDGSNNEEHFFCRAHQRPANVLKNKEKQ